jgi:uncharacterized membrane protein YkoI
MDRTVVAALTAIFLAAAPFANAAGTSGGTSGTASGTSTTDTTKSDSAAQMTEAQIKSKLQQMGYTSVSEIKRSGNGYQVTAMKDGQEQQLEVDARTGAIESQK